MAGRTATATVRACAQNYSVVTLCAPSLLALRLLSLPEPAHRFVTGMRMHTLRIKTCSLLASQRSFGYTALRLARRQHAHMMMRTAGLGPGSSSSRPRHSSSFG